jgi:hypothetical protein
MLAKNGKDIRNGPETKAKVSIVTSKALKEEANKSEDIAYEQEIQIARQWALYDQSVFANQLETSLESAIGTALVTLTVLEFKGILPDDRNWHVFTPCENHMVKHEIALIKHDRVKLKGKNFVVEGFGPVTFRFRIEDKKAQTVYYPVGISFKRRETGGEKDVMDACARRFFSNNTIHIFGTDMYFTYDYRNYEGQTYNYDFFVVIQRDSDGLMGIIDPGIGHDNDNSD